MARQLRSTGRGTDPPAEGAPELCALSKLGASVRRTVPFRWRLYKANEIAIASATETNTS